MAEATTTTNPITQLVSEAQLLPETEQELLQTFGPLYSQAKDWAKKARTLEVTDFDQTDKMRDAREARLALKAVRVEADHKRRELKEDGIRKGRAIQGAYKVLEDLIKPTEAYLLQQEKYTDLRLAAERAALEAQRLQEASPYSDYMAANLDYGTMSEDEFRKMLRGAKLAKEADEAEAAAAAKAQAEAEAKAKAEAEAKAKAEAEERARIRAENERLRKEAAEREAQRKAEAEARRQQEEAEAKARAEAEAKAAREQQAREDAARKEREALQAKLDAERKAREDAEAKARAAEEEKRAQEAAEKRRQAEEAEAAAAATDRDKLLRLGADLAEVKIPTVESGSARRLVGKIEDALESLCSELYANLKD